MDFLRLIIGADTGARHWCLKSINIGLARAKVPSLKNLAILTPRIDALSKMHANL